MAKFKNCFITQGDMYRYEITASEAMPQYGIEKGDLLAKAHSLTSHEKAEIESKSYDYEVTAGNFVVKPKSSHTSRIVTIKQALDSWEFGSEITEKTIAELAEPIQIVIANAINQHEIAVNEIAADNEKN